MPLIVKVQARRHECGPAAAGPRVQHAEPLARCDLQAR